VNAELQVSTLGMIYTTLVNEHPHGQLFVSYTILKSKKPVQP